MRAGPLVSVMMPCFNASETLPMAVASLLAQTHENWEAVIVDDGSTDSTSDLLQSVGDSRLRWERFAQNRGRGAARQRCLEMAEGEYLAFLDSDDWLFPRKLERQVAILESEPDVSIVSAGSVITERADRPIGLSKFAIHGGRIVSTFAKPGAPPLEFPCSMIRMDIAKAGHFDPAFLRSQDSDFLIRIMLGKRYVVIREPLYAYSQGSAATLEKTLQGYEFRLRCYRKYKNAYPVRVARLTAQTWGKMLAYRAAGAVGLEGRLIRQRWRPLTPEAQVLFEEAFEQVARIEQDMSVGMN